ncbi:TPA: hypothetical protein HA243_05760 [Candidatus Micrarchaeota archaeon]|nr:hypothetical protein [Candidatus Micrarchaeota archaeon]
MADAQAPKAPPAGAKAQGQQPIPAIPTVGGFRLLAERTRGMAELSQRYSQVSFLEMTQDKDTLSVLNVESRDLRKDPALFSIIKFMPSRIEVVYTCLANTSPKKRRLEVLRHFLNMLTIADDCYSVDMKQVYQLLESSLADMNEYVSSDYDRLFSVYDSLRSDHASLAKKVKDLTESASNLSKENYDLKNRNDELSVRLKGLETLSDTVLSLKIQEWLAEHKGEINISDFSKVYNVPENRVEQMLNKLVTEGYLETKG